MLKTKSTNGRGSAQVTRSLADDLVVDDVLVFSRVDAGFRLIGGTGRGEGWAEIVALLAADEPITERAWRTGLPIRIDAEQPTQIAGPYWARHAVVVPVGHDHLVVFGSASPITESDALVVRVAAQTVAQTGSVSAEKLLGDELELVHAIRALMDYRAETVRDTARHVALIAARALSCDVGVVHVANPGGEALEAIHLLDRAEHSEAAGPDAAEYLRAASSLNDLRVEHTVTPNPRLWNSDVVSRLTVPIGVNARLGALALGHSIDRPRGFTLLCQRIARALAEAAELLLEQAITREALAAERELLHRIIRTDPLTGLSNRTGWDEAVKALAAAPGAADRGYAILSADLDRLKAINDRYGHPVGDAVIRGAANLLRMATREGDTVARVGGDEFLVLLPGADAEGAARMARRVRRNIRRWRVTEHGLSPNLSIGWSASNGEDVAVASLRADQQMYAAKRRRSRLTIVAPADSQRRKAG